MIRACLLYVPENIPNGKTVSETVNAVIIKAKYFR